jgi:hypothetical protein
VLQRLDGPTLKQLWRSGAMTSAQTGAILAISVRKTASPPDVFSLRDLMNGSLRLSGGTLPKHIATGILTLIERLAPGDGLCHGDLHPRQRDHDGGWSETHRLGGAPRARRPVATTVAPCSSTKTSAIFSPMPLIALVTMATLPSRAPMDVLRYSPILGLSDHVG